MSMELGIIPLTTRKLRDTHNSVTPLDSISIVQVLDIGKGNIRIYLECSSLLHFPIVLLPLTSSCFLCEFNYSCLLHRMLVVVVI
jgi:hypothetical protein